VEIKTGKTTAGGAYLTAIETNGKAKLPDRTSGCDRTRPTLLKTEEF
jgi:hypothetical protein